MYDDLYAPYSFYASPYRPIRIIYYYYPYYNYRIPSNRETYPSVDVTLFNKSAIAMQSLIKEAGLVLNKIAASKSFAYNVMKAAQESNMQEVNRLIKSTGIKAKVDTSFNPDGINLKLSSQVDKTDCCKLTIGLRWG